MIKPISFLLFVVSLMLAAFLILISDAFGQSINGDLVRLRPSSLPTSCNTGDLRTDSADSYKLKQCVSGSWGEVGGNPLPAYTSGYVLYGDGTDTPVATSGLSFNAGTGVLTATSFVGSVTGNADTATALASNPSDCGSDTYATTIAANGNLTCASITNASTTGTTVNTGSTLVLRDSSGDFAAGTITAALSGNASTATALASNPSDCSANQFANAIAASGNLTCSQPAFTDISGVATIAQGGTNNGSLGVTAGGVTYTDGSKLANTGAGTTGQILTSNGSSAPTWQAAPAGGTNDQKEYVSNGKFETDVTGWTTYDDAAAAPVDGTGGTVTTTFTRTTTAGEVIRDSGSGELSKGAANYQGEGVCTTWTMDRNEAASMKATPVSFEYQTTTNYASGDVLMYVIDVTAATVQAVPTVQSTTAGTVLASSTPTRWNGIFYPTTTNTSYKLCWHIATTNASAWDMHIDSVHVGNQNVTPGAIVADLGTEAWTDNQANSTTSVKLARFGNRIFVDGVVTFTGAMSGQFTLTIPTAYTAASTYDQSQSSIPVGNAGLRDVGTDTEDGLVVMTSATTLNIYSHANPSGTRVNWGGTSSTAPFTWASGDKIFFTANWEVSGWSASAALSTTETFFASAKFSAGKSATQTISSASATKVTWSTPSKDNLGGFDDANDRYVVQRTGRYIVSASLGYVNTSSETFTVFIYVNGSPVRAVAFNGSTTLVPIVEQLELVKGDYIEIFSDSTADTSYDVLATSTGTTWFSVSEMPDFSIFSVYGISDYQSATASTTNLPSTTNFGDLTSLTLPPGEWDLGFNVIGHRNTASEAAWTVFGAGISTTSGNSSSGLSLGVNYMRQTQTYGFGVDAPLHLGGYRVTPTTTTTYYLKYTGTYGSNQPQAEGTIYARKVK